MLEKHKELKEISEKELNRQKSTINLIPSENYVSRDVLEALATVFTNKYSEGYPGKRYYSGQENTDLVENYAINAAKKLFNCDHANVQPYSGAQANMAAYFSWMDPGDTVLSMDLSHGGHLTHGDPRTALAKIFNFMHYKIKDIETGEIDYGQMRDLALKHRPKMIMAGYSSYPRNIDYQKVSEIASEAGAVAIADIAHTAGIIAGKALPNPFDYGFQICTSTTHKTLRGPRGGLILSKGKVSNPVKKIEKTFENIPTLIDRSVFPGIQGGPHMNVIFAKAVAFDEAFQPDFQVYATQIIKNAKKLAQELMNRGFKLVTNGTDNHLILIDMIASFGIGGEEAEKLFESAGITTNKNLIPDDPRKPFDPSGIRIGTPAITTRGLKEGDMAFIAEIMQKAITNKGNTNVIISIKNDVAENCKKYPLPY